MKVAGRLRAGSGLNLKTAVESGSTRKCPAKQRLAGGCPFTLRVKGVWHRFQTVIPAKAGIYGSKKRRSCRYLAWVPAFAGTTLRLDPACVFARKSASTAGSRMNLETAVATAKRPPLSWPGLTRPSSNALKTRLVPCCMDGRVKPGHDKLWLTRRVVPQKRSARCSSARFPVRNKLNCRI